MSSPTQELPPETRLPPLRDELTITRGAPLLTGAPSWVVHDPVRHRYLQLDRRTVELLGLWSAGTTGALRHRFRRDRGGEVTDAELRDLLQFLQANSLLVSPPGDAAQAFAAQAAAQTTSIWALLTRRYLFFRIPLVRPERFLAATWPIVQPLFSRAFVILLAIIGVFGLYLASRQITAVEAHLRDAVSLSGAATYAAALVVVKLLHELGHAYQAHARGLRVPTMGVAFMVLFPLFYTDMTDAWRLTKRRDRLMVDAGGVMVELGVAAIATLIWCFLPDGPMRSAMFAIATASWVLSLLVNLNPFMRFDGYYFLADAMGVQNLQPRAFALGKWRLREALFGLGHPPPEPMEAGLRRWVVVYAYAVWIYRLFLFLAIALIVYAFFFKALGVILFAVEIFFFVLRPVLNELKAWWTLRSEIMGQRRTLVTGGVLAALGVALFWPFETPVRAPATLSYAVQHPIHAATPARLETVLVAHGQRVEADAPLLQLAAPDLKAEQAQAEAETALLRLRLDRIAGDATDRAARTVLLRELEAAEERLAALEAEKARLTVRAPVAGVVADLSSDLSPGRWVGVAEQLAVIVDPAGLEVRGYLSEADLDRIAPGAAGVFTPDDPALPKSDTGAVIVADHAVGALSDAYLSAQAGGPVPLEPDGDPLQPVGAWFPVSTTLADGAQTPPARVVRGALVTTSRPQSYAERIGRRVAQVLVRESTF